MSEGRYGVSGAFWLIVAAVFLAGLAAGLSRLALARYMRYDLGASVLLVSSLTSWFMAPRAAAALLGGLLSDLSARARRLFMSAPMLAISALVYLLGLLRDPYLIVLLSTVWGLLSGLVWPTTQTVTALLVRHRAGSAMSVYFASAFLGMVLGQGLYGLLPLGNAALVRLSSLFFAAAGLLLAAASRSAPPPPPLRRGLRRGLREAASSLGPVAVWILFTSLVMGYDSGMMREFLYVYLGDVYRLSRQDLAGVLSTAGILAFLASLATGPAADRLGPRPVLRLLLAAGAAGMLSIGLAPSATWALLGIALVNTATRSSLPLTRNAAFLGTAMASTLVAASNTLNNLGQMTSPLVSAWLYQSLHSTQLGPVPGHAAPFLVAAALTIAVLAATPRPARETR
jgi:MFS family permease